MSARMNLPDCIQITYPVPDYPVYEIKHEKAEARVALHGAHLLEWTPADQKPVIYLSPQAVYQEGKAVRGGVPVCWPWFGPPLEDASLPMHGFVRNQFWELASAEQNKAGVQLCFTLKDNADSRKLWPYAFELSLTMAIGETLRLELRMKNTGEDTLFITDALHTYLCVGDVTRVSIAGLERTEYLDRVGAPMVRQQRGRVAFDKEVDRDYAANGSVVLSDPSLNRELKIRSDGSRSTVVWNPWIEKSKRLPDLPDEAYQTFVCIETANAWRDEKLLPPGSTHLLAYTLECGALAATDG